MKIYPPDEGFTAEEMKNGQWSLYVDVTCQDCKKVWSAANVGGIDGKCKKCGGQCN